MRTPLMSSRQRMLAALKGQEADHPPCSFMMYNALKAACKDYAEFIERQVAMGLDAFVEIPPRPPAVVNDHYNLHGLPVSYDPEVVIREWVDRVEGEAWPVMIKEYRTPAGTLRAEVRQTPDWRWGNHVPFLDDYLIPRSRKFLITEPGDLSALRYLLTPPTPEEVAAFRRESEPVLALAKRHDLMTAGGWGVGADLIGWIYGLEAMLYTVYDQPDLLTGMLALIADWNRRRMKVVLDLGIDLFIKRAWYENLDFWTPAAWRTFLLPIVQVDADLAHERGARFGYIISSNCMALLPILKEAGIDVLIGVDPLQWDMARARRELEGHVCLWGGVNGHLTVEQGTPAQVRAAVREALSVLSPGGGFILSPVDNVREDTPRSRENVAALIEAWRELAGLSGSYRV